MGILTSLSPFPTVPTCSRHVSFPPYIKPTTPSSSVLSLSSPKKILSKKEKTPKISMDLSSIRGLLTPSVLFLLLNLVIGTIAVISSRHRLRSGGPPNPLARSSSSNVLERVRSLGLFRFRSGDLPPIVDFNSDQDPTDTVELHQQQPVLYRRVQSESDSKAKAKAKESGGVKIKKSASAMTWRSDEEEEEEEEEVLKRSAKAMVRRSPETVDEEVDAKADDFINRFRQQLKLQRLDSLLRYKEMLGK